MVSIKVEFTNNIVSYVLCKMTNPFFKKIFKNIKSHHKPRRIARLIRNIYIDLKFGGFLGGDVETPYKHLGANRTGNTDYSALPFIFNNQISHTDVLVDIGCGKGRVLNWWLLNYPNNKIYGIEINKLIADKVSWRLRNFKNVHIICGSAVDNIPYDANIFYMFYPFKGKMVDDFKDRIFATGGLNSTGKKIKILLYTQITPTDFCGDARFKVTKVQMPKRFYNLFLIEVLSVKSILCR